MKNIVIAIVAFLLLMLYSHYDSQHGRCASCGEHMRLSESFPYCFADLCDSCDSDVDHEIERADEITYENAYKDGYDEGYEYGYYDGDENGREEGYDEGYTDGYNDGYGEIEDELNFWRDSAVIVTTTGEKYHTYDCYHIDGRRYYIYNIELAKYKGYTACLDCIGW
jgi:hypothetical protein